MQLSDFGKEYLLLGLRMGKLIDKYVDAYFGPKDLKYIVYIYIYKIKLVVFKYAIKN